MDTVHAKLRQARSRPLILARAAYREALADVRRCAYGLATNGATVQQMRQALRVANMAGYVAMKEE